MRIGRSNVRTCINILCICNTNVFTSATKAEAAEFQIETRFVFSAEIEVTVNERLLVPEIDNHVLQICHRAHDFSINRHDAAAVVAYICAIPGASRC